MVRQEKDNPLISVLLPVYNAGAYLKEGVESVLAQTYEHLELICINDGSKDDSLAILKNFAQRDARVRVFENDKNRGIIYTLNRAVGLAQGTFIARMDADDRSAKDRLSKELRYLQAHPDVDVVSCGLVFIDQSGKSIARHPPVCLTPGGAVLASFFMTAIAHAAVMGRIEVFKKYSYASDADVWHTEDYELWTRMVRSGVLMANIPDLLYLVRINPAGVSRTYEGEQVDHFVRCAKRHLESYFNIMVRERPHRVMVNRMNHSIPSGAYRRGLKLMAKVRKLYRNKFPDMQAEERADCRQVFIRHKLDILIQGIKRGRPATVIFAITAAICHFSLFLSKTGRTYLRSKFYIDGIIKFRFCTMTNPLMPFFLIICTGVCY